MAGMGHTNHSAGGPSRSTAEMPTMPRAMPQMNSTRKNGTSINPYTKNDRPKMPVARITMTASPIKLVRMLESTSPARYSGIDSGVANKFRKLRDHTSSKNAIVTPCITRVRKSHSRTAPSIAGTKLKPAEETAFKYLVMKPHNTMSTPTHAKSGSTREKLPRMR